LLAALPRLGSDRAKPLLAIPGQPPRRIDPAPGCPFAERCPLVEAACRDRDPDVQHFAGGHQVACIHADKDEA
jgi:oligopeptide/dipeptide ABC transporter ATP-binding protein